MMIVMHISSVRQVLLDECTKNYGFECGMMASSTRLQLLEPMFREVFGHNRSNSLCFQVQIMGCMLWSFSLGLVFQRL